MKIINYTRQRKKNTGSKTMRKVLLESLQSLPCRTYRDSKGIAAVMGEANSNIAGQKYSGSLDLDTFDHHSVK
ncbi:MAG: hypothetical protein R2685_06205 [Candidatus Nitrosocosmicus sp.]|nr:hypothetical protein [Candidatus Nitrosocosmicus sp.]